MRPVVITAYKIIIYIRLNKLYFGNITNSKLKLFTDIFSQLYIWQYYLLVVCVYLFVLDDKMCKQRQIPLFLSPNTNKNIVVSLAKILLPSIEEFKTVSKWENGHLVRIATSKF